MGSERLMKRVYMSDVGGTRGEGGHVSGGYMEKGVLVMKEGYVQRRQKGCVGIETV